MQVTIQSINLGTIEILFLFEIPQNPVNETGVVKTKQHIGLGGFYQGPDLA
jgi:hypothetical protein